MTPDLYSDDVDPRTTADITSQALVRLQATTDAYIHYQTISFPSILIRECWGNLVDKSHRGIFEDLGKFIGHDIKVAHFSDSRISWARANAIHNGQTPWNRVTWRHWTAAMIMPYAGHHVNLIIYDNNPTEAAPGDYCSTVLTRDQLMFWEWLKEKRPVRVYYCIDESERGPHHSPFGASMRRVAELAAYGDKELEDDDPRLRNCVALRDI